LLKKEKQTHRGRQNKYKKNLGHLSGGSPFFSSLVATNQIQNGGAPPPLFLLVFLFPRLHKEKKKEKRRGGTGDPPQPRGTPLFRTPEAVCGSIFPALGGHF